MNPLSNDSLRAAFSQAVDYPTYIKNAQSHEQTNWNTFHSRIKLSESQRALLASFTRQVNILCISGSWCGDCVQQVPFLDHLARATPKITFRLLERDDHAGFASNFKICSGDRVPVVMLMNEDFDFCALLGDRTLARYRSLAQRQLGGACPLPGAPVPPDEVAAQLQDWLNDIERIQLMLRLSTKLRNRHGD
jgi:thiol-disulfide isomerase/thioredoxin